MYTITGRGRGHDDGDVHRDADGYRRDQCDDEQRPAGGRRRCDRVTGNAGTAVNGDDAAIVSGTINYTLGDDAIGSRSRCRWRARA